MTTSKTPRRPSRARSRHGKPAAQGDGRTMRVAKQTGVVVGLISGIAGLLFLFFPGLRPGTGGSNADQLPTITAVAATPGVTQGAFLASHDRKPTGFTKEQLALVGASISAQIQIFGYKGKHLPLEEQV